MRNQLQSHRINQCFVDVGMVMCNRISADVACVLFMWLLHIVLDESAESPLRIRHIIEQ